MTTATNSNQQQPATGYYSSTGAQLTAPAFWALKAATMRQQIGNHAARRMAIRNGSTMRLYVLACQLLAMQRAEQQAPLDFTQQVAATRSK